MRWGTDAVAAMRKGLDDIRSSFDVPTAFPGDVLAAAEAAASRPPGDEHIDATAWEFMTLDPAQSKDLDQAFALERDGDTIVLRYAIADVNWFVRPGDALDIESWKRGITVYLPDGRAPLYPPVISEGAASLLPGEDRPSYVFTVHVDAEGEVGLAGCERAIVRSRAKLAYDDVTPSDLPEPFADLSARIVAAEERRDAQRVEFPEQELERTDDGWRLAFRLRLGSEEQNAGLSLACNLAVADALLAAKTGLYRVLAEVEDHHVRRLRYTARALGLEWADDIPLATFQRSLPGDDPRAAAFLIAVRRAGGKASYEPYRKGCRPWQSALQATYVHATAPLRRLADRYVIEAAHAVANGQAVPDHVTEAFAELPQAMESAEALANQVERAAVDLAEAVLLDGREGEIFDAVIIDEDERGAQMQIADPAIIARVVAHDVDPGDAVKVRLVDVDQAARRIDFERVS